MEHWDLRTLALEPHNPVVLHSARGQTASEYMGILLVVAVIIAAVVKSGIAGSIGDRIGDLVDAIGGSS